MSDRIVNFPGRDGKPSVSAAQPSEQGLYLRMAVAKSCEQLAARIKRDDTVTIAPDRWDTLGTLIEMLHTFIDRAVRCGEDPDRK